MITYFFNPGTKIVEVTFTGKITIDEIVQNIIDVNEDPILPCELRILCDAMQAKAGFSLKDLGKLSNVLDRYKDRFQFTREALLQDDPIIAAFSGIFEWMIRIRANYTFKVFSTRAAAEKWLLQ